MIYIYISGTINNSKFINKYTYIWNLLFMWTNNVTYVRILTMSRKKIYNSKYTFVLEKEAVWRAQAVLCKLSLLIVV